ncbi:apolipoprotein N-acyltransferase [Thermosynechococcus vestitus]|uniref:Apolipoprotein N-acyltransferase n=1 Tax=Thermosynechococcus vestitus (strain NIES-2133 / IAM M-273 / BP-1) TaxID=197221 RepID=LNT_THEVB|nr:apolipoprotein N-acyltransferase [Thermosynechococcus vestitus]Q8DIC3.1 RecName: Full=Apolipoprotein N-acyltransferase; Short=ALP N-acyltransferase [Thermosynechococcus vestitus BP-1]BAC09219.1 apolipoprotein N-acyltransferase [Thermosynechococcus vestitus BP-1]
MWRLPPKSNANAKVLSRWLLFVGLGIAGWGTQLALPPVSGWFLAFVGIVPLWWQCQVLAPLWAAIAGLCWGWGFYGSSLVWVWDLHPLTWIGIDPVPSWLISRGIWLCLSSWGAVLSGSWALLMARYGVRRSAPWQLLWGVTLWCALEALWSHSPLWWISLSLTQSPGGLVQLGRLAGPTTITAVVMTVNGLVTLSLRQQKWARVGLAMTLVAAIALNGVLSVRVMADRGEPLRVGLIQGNIPTREKLTPEGIRRAWQVYLQGYHQLVSWGVDAVLTPEGALPILWQPQQMNPITEAVREAGVPLWLGTFMETAGGSHQVLLSLDGNGEIDSHYGKVNLVPLGEYIPPWLGGVVQRLSTLRSPLIPGDPEQVFTTPWGNAVVLICFESAFSHRSRWQLVHGGQFILSVANDDPYHRQLMTQHHGHDVLRAVEGDRWLVRCTNTGLSAVIAPTGETLWLSKADEFVIYAATIFRRQTETLYTRYGDWLLPLLLGMLSLSVLRQRGWH